MPFLAVKDDLFVYFAQQLGEQDWRGKDVLDFGGNIGGLLLDPTSTIDAERYWCIDIIKEAIEAGRDRYPTSHWVHYDKYNFFFNPHGVPGLEIPDVDQQFDIIAAYSVVTNNGQASMLSLIPQLERMLKPGGVLAFTFIDHDFHTWPGEYEGNNLAWRLEKCMREQPQLGLDIPGLVARANGSKWCILVNDRELYVDTHELPDYAPEDQETFHMFYSREHMASLFPHATILAPANREMQHCVVIHRQREA